jgi:hypothetical protein
VQAAKARDLLLTSESSCITFKSVTLTQDLKHPNPVSEFLHQSMVDLESHQKAWLTQSSRHPELDAVEDGNTREAATRFGLAMEWAINFDLANEVPYQAELDAFRADGGDRAAHLVASAGFSFLEGSDSANAPWSRWARTHRPSDRPDHEAMELLAGCWSLTQIIELLHRPHFAEPGGILTKCRFWEDMYEPTTEAPWLAGPWDAYRRLGRPQLDALGQPVDIGVKLIDRYATADLLLGSTVIDIKCSIDPVPKLTEWLRQVVAYALLVPDRSVHRVGIYLVRQARLVTWELAELLPGINLDDASREFTSITLKQAPE